jgi:hypothetical protein
VCWETFLLGGEEKRGKEERGGGDEMRKIERREEMRDNHTTQGHTRKQKQKDKHRHRETERKD